MPITVQIQKSRFQLNQENVLNFLKNEIDQTTKETRLYDHQIKAVSKTVDHFNNDRKTDNIGLLQIPTGGGKSGIISLLPYALGSHKVMVLSPGLVITNQLESTFGGKCAKESFYFNMEIAKESDICHFIPIVTAIRSSKKLPDMEKYELVIVNAQKFNRNNKPEIILNGDHETIRANIFEKFDTIIVDEAHHYPAATWSDIIEIFKEKKIIFLTATPKPEFCYIIYQIERKKLQELKIIREIEFEQLHFDDINNVTDQELRDIAFKIKQTLEEQDNTVNNIKHKAMVLVKNNKEYAKQMAERFNSIIDLNLKATYCISDHKSEKNLKGYNKKNDQYRIMVVCQRLTEGYDNSNVSVCAILRNIGSDILFNQFVGRCIRISQDRENLQNDDVVAKVYAPKRMWDRYERNATSDPKDEVEDGENQTRNRHQENYPSARYSL